MTTDMPFENEEQLKSYLNENYDLSPGRYESIKSVCEYLELYDEIDDSEFEGIKSVFNSYISKRTSGLVNVGLNIGDLSALRSKGFIDGNNQLLLKGFEVLKIVSHQLSYR